MYRFEIILSRFVDYVLLYIVGVWLSFFLPVYVDPLFYIVFALLLPLLWAPLEALCIQKLGTTPGSALFGIHYKTETHFYKRLKQALWRERREEVIEVRGGKKRFLTGIIFSIFIALVGLFSPLVFHLLSGERVKPTTSGWMHFHSPAGSFGVDFPAEPYQAPKELVVPITRDPIPYTEYKSFQKDDGAITYSVSFLQLPLRVRFYGDNTVLKACLGFLPENGPTAKVLSEQLAPYHRYSAINFALRNGTEISEGRLIMANGKLYKLVVNYPEGTEEATLHLADFLDSFHIRYVFGEAY